MPVQLPRPRFVVHMQRVAKWRAEMTEVMRSGAIIVMGLTVLAATVFVMIYG